MDKIDKINMFSVRKQALLKYSDKITLSMVLLAVSSTYLEDMVNASIQNAHTINHGKMVRASLPLVPCPLWFHCISQVPCPLVDFCSWDGANLVPPRRSRAVWSGCTSSRVRIALTPRTWKGVGVPVTALCGRRVCEHLTHHISPILLSCFISQKNSEIHNPVLPELDSFINNILTTIAYSK